MRCFEERANCLHEGACLWASVTEGLLQPREREAAPVFFGPLVELGGRVLCFTFVKCYGRIWIKGEFVCRVDILICERREVRFEELLFFDALEGREAGIAVVVVNFYFQVFQIFCAVIEGWEWLHLSMERGNCMRGLVAGLVRNVV